MKLTLNQTKSAFTLLCACAILPSLPQASNATILAYEPFDYAAGTDPSAAGSNGGSGFAGGWGNRSGNSVVPGTDAIGDSIGAGSLNYTDAFGNQLVTSGGRLNVSGALGTSNPYREFNFIRGTVGTTTWISFLGQRSGETSTVEQALNPYPRASNLSFYTADGLANAERLAVGSSSGMAVDSWSLIPRGGGGNLVGASPTTSLAVESLLVLRIDHTGNAAGDDAYMWVNPVLSSVPDIASASAVRLAADPAHVDPFPYTFNAVRPFAGNFSAAQPRPFAVADFDELRIGETFGDVTPFTAVPEPSVSMLLLSALGAVTMRRRRK